MIDLNAAVEKERLELEALLAKDPVDEAAALAQSKKMEAARSALGEERFRFIIEVRKIVGLEFFERLKGMLREFRERVDHRRREGPPPGERPLAKD